MAERDQEIENARARLWVDRRIEVGLSLLLVLKKKHRINTCLQRILCAFVFQRRLVKGYRWYSHPANEECAGGAPNPLHYHSGNS